MKRRLPRRIRVPTLAEAEKMMRQVNAELRAHIRKLEDSRRITAKDLEARFRCAV